jgi:1-deoxy-D-xylulose-5-phosphate synthase
MHRLPVTFVLDRRRPGPTKTLPTASPDLAVFRVPGLHRRPRDAATLPGAAEAVAVTDGRCDVSSPPGPCRPTPGRHPRIGPVDVLAEADRADVLLVRGAFGHLGVGINTPDSRARYSVTVVDPRQVRGSRPS